MKITMVKAKYLPRWYLFYEADFTIDVNVSYTEINQSHLDEFTRVEGKYSFIHPFTFTK